MSPDDFCEVVITAPDGEWLAAFVRRLVDDRLSAEGQITPIRVVYRWEGADRDEVEARAVLHTRASLVPAIIDRTNAEHPFEAPCVVALPIVQGNPGYLKWVGDSTREP